MKTHKNRKAIWSIVCALIFIAIIVTAVVIRNTAVRKNTEKPAAAVPEEETDYYNGLPIGWVLADYSFNPYDYRDLVGDADYVFVGKVLENKGVIYENEHTVAGEGGEKVTFNDPYTVYSVEVEKNIKGNLVESIEIKKGGGLVQSGEYYRLIEDDIFPEVGERYIFSAYAQDDGSLIDSGACSTIPYTDEELDAIESAAANQTVFNRQHHVSIYDVDYNQ